MISQREVTRTIGTSQGEDGGRGRPMKFLSSIATTQGVMLCNRDIDLQKVPGVDDLLGDYVEARFGEGGPW